VPKGTPDSNQPRERDRGLHRWPCTAMASHMVLSYIWHGRQSRAL
jgi:hypothetical protein